MMRALPILALALACSHGGHGLRNGHHHAPRDIETYIARLESPERVRVLQVPRVLEAIQLKTSSDVADIGAGPGVFSLPLARAVPEGLVYAVDVEPMQLDALRSRMSAASVQNVIPVLASLDNPFLPTARLDLILVVDTYHHIEDRIDYFSRLKRTLTPAGRLAIIEWKPGDIGMGPPPQHKLAPGVREKELRDAGYERVQRLDFHRLHDFEIWEVRGR